MNNMRSQVILSMRQGKPNRLYYWIFFGFPCYYSKRHYRDISNVVEQIKGKNELYFVILIFYFLFDVSGTRHPDK